MSSVQKLHFQTTHQAFVKARFFELLGSLAAHSFGRSESSEARVLAVEQGLGVAQKFIGSAFGTAVLMLQKKVSDHD